MKNHQLGWWMFIQTTSYTYNILKRVFGNLIFKFCLENFLHQYESIGPFWNTVLKKFIILNKKKNGKADKIHFTVLEGILLRCDCTLRLRWR